MASPAHLTARLLAALDRDYNVVDMRAIEEVISALENINITKELLETTRLGKHVNELRRRTGDAALARRTKLLVKRWRDLVIPDKAGSKPSTQPTSAESTPRQSPLASRGISPTVTPSVTPQLSNPQVSFQGFNTHKSSLTPPDGIRSLQHLKRQPLTPNALRNLSPGLRNSSLTQRNSSPNLKNVTSVSRTSSPAQRNLSPSIRNVSPAVRNLSPCVKPSHDVNLVSPALRLPSENTKVWSGIASKDPYDSDSQDVILVDDNDDDVKPSTNNIKHLFNIEQNDKSSKRPRSPINGGPETSLYGDELQRDAKKAKREISGKKAKKKRSHSRSENRTTDHSSDPASIGSPFLPISSASTSPALSIGSNMRNGLSLPTTPIESVVIDDLDSRSPVPMSDSKLKALRKNGCKKPSVEVDDYSNFIKTRIPIGGRKVKTTKELSEEMQAKKSGKLPTTSILEKRAKPKEDFLTVYDSQKQMKKETVILTDIIELNDSNSSSKIESAPQSPKDKSDSTDPVKTEGGTSADEKPIKFESADVILSRLPPIDYDWKDFDEVTAPVCSCSFIYDDADSDKDSPPRKSIFELDNADNAEPPESIVEPEQRIDSNCEAARVYEKKPAEVSCRAVDALHNNYIADVNGSTCKPSEEKVAKLACKPNVWGLKPYYDCSRDMFHSVVPKYNYLDTSLDRCVKNLESVVLDKYEPAEPFVETDNWFLALENEHLNKWIAENESRKCDNFEGSSDSPFSETKEEEADDEDCTEENDAIGTSLNSDKISDNNNVKLDSDAKASTQSPKTEENKSDETSTNLDSEEKKKKSNCFEVLEYQVSIPYREFSTGYTKSLFADDLDFFDEPTSPDATEPIVDIPMECDPVTEASPVQYFPKSVKQFSYEDNITLLPLSLNAINSHVTYDDNCRITGDLASVFKSDEDQSPKETNDLSYSLVKTVKIVDANDFSNSVISRTRELCMDGFNEDANCDSDINKLKLVDNLTNSGAFVNNSEEEKCVKDGCPSWIPGSVPADSFREWHEPVVRTSYNEEPLTILPYVVID